MTRTSQNDSQFDPRPPYDWKQVLSSVAFAVAIIVSLSWIFSWSDSDDSASQDDYPASGTVQTNPTWPKLDPERLGYECFDEGELFLGDYPEITRKLFIERGMTWSGYKSGQLCVDRDVWAQLMLDTRRTAHQEAEKRLNKVLAKVEGDQVAKLEAVIQWTCDGNAAGSQEWAVAEDAYERYWRVDFELNAPDSLADAVNHFCSRADTYGTSEPNLTLGGGGKAS